MVHSAIRVERERSVADLCTWSGTEVLVPDYVLCTALGIIGGPEVEEGDLRPPTSRDFIFGSTSPTVSPSAEARWGVLAALTSRVRQQAHAPKRIPFNVIKECLDSTYLHQDSASSGSLALCLEVSLGSA